MDRMLFQETFSQLHASDGAKQEVLQMTENRKHSRRRLAGAARVAGIAAAAMMALVVTAGAINVATDGAFLEGFTILWVGDKEFVAQNEAGDEVYMVSADDGIDFVTEEEGSLIPHPDREIDITDALAENGSYHYEYEVTVSSEDGREDTEVFTVDVTGSTEEWTATQRNGIGVAVTITSENGEVSRDILVGAEAMDAEGAATDMESGGKSASVVEYQTAE